MAQQQTVNMMEATLLLLVDDKGGISRETTTFLKAAAALQAVISGLVTISPGKSSNCYLVPVENPNAGSDDSLINDLAATIEGESKQLVNEFVRKLDGSIVSKSKMGHITDKVSDALGVKGLLRVERGTLSKKYWLTEEGKALGSALVNAGSQTMCKGPIENNEYNIGIATVLHMLNPHLNGFRFNPEEVQNSKNRMKEYYQTRPTHDCIVNLYGVHKPHFGILWFFNPMNLLPPMP